MRAGVSGVNSPCGGMGDADVADRTMSFPVPDSGASSSKIVSLPDSTPVTPPGATWTPIEHDAPGAKV